MRAATRSSHYVPARRTDSAHSGHANLAVGDSRRQLIHGHPFRAFDRNACYSAGMSSRSASQIFRLVAPAPNYQCPVRNPFRHLYRLALREVPTEILQTRLIWWGILLVGPLPGARWIKLIFLGELRIGLGLYYFTLAVAS